MLAKNHINRNKTDNKAKSDNKNLDFMSFIYKQYQWTYRVGVEHIFLKWLVFKVCSLLK